MKAAVIKHLRDHHNEATAAATRAQAETGIQIMHTQSRTASIHKSLYSNRTSFLCCAVLKVGTEGAADMVEVVDAADMVDVVSAVDVVDADTVDLRTCGLVDAVGCGRDQGPWDMERKDRVFCSHIGSKNTSIF